MKKKIIISLISFTLLAIIGCLIGFNWKSIKAFLNGTKVYTEEEMQKNYDKGYKDASTNEKKYLEQIGKYKDLLEVNELQINNLTNSVTNLTNSNNEYKNEIDTLNVSINTNKTTISNLQKLVDSNNTTISNLNSEIEDKQSTITQLRQEIVALETQNNNNTIEIENRQNQINSLNTQVKNLQTLVNQLNATNETNMLTISTLNNQIKSLNSQISSLQLEINNNDKNVINLNSKISELEKSVAYYEEYIATLETETQVVVTFEFDGSVYNVQVINKGNYVSVVNPTSTDYVTFNGWMVNDEIIDLSTYQISENTKFVADVTYKYSVEFSVDGSVIDTQIIEKDNLVTIPSIPTKEGYTFDGWSIDEINAIDLSAYKIDSDTTFVALFTKLHSVTFVYEDEVINTQTIRNGNNAEDVEVESTEYKVFNGWLLNGSGVDLSTYKITSDTEFVADITYYYDIKFVSEGADVESVKVKQDNYATCSTTPTKQYYNFIGWSIDGSNVVDLSTYQIKSDVTFIAVFERRMVIVTFLDEQYGSTLATKSVAAGDVIGDIDVVAPEKEDYEFRYWAQGWTATEVDLDTYVVTSSISLYPYYEQILYSVQFIDNGQVLATQKYEVGANSLITNPPQPLGREGMNFNGWVNSGYSSTINLSTYKINSDKILVAHYSLPYAGVYQGTVSGNTVTLKIETYSSKGLARTTQYGTTVPNIHNYTDVVNENGRVYINGLVQNDLVHNCVEYNAVDNTWIYSEFFYDRDYNVSHQNDYVLTFVSPEDTGTK